MSVNIILRNIACNETCPSQKLNRKLDLKSGEVLFVIFVEVH